LIIQPFKLYVYLNCHKKLVIYNVIM